METKNAIITSAEIYIEDHGILTATVRLDYGSVVQGFGGYNLDMDGEAKMFIRGCLRAAGVDKWSDLKGKTIRVRATPSHVLAIGHIIKAQIEANYLRRENDALCKENAEISLDAKEGRKIRRALEAHIEAAEKAEENKLLQYPYGKVCADDRHPG